MKNKSISSLHYKIIHIMVLFVLAGHFLVKVNDRYQLYNNGRIENFVVKKIVERKGSFISKAIIQYRYIIEVNGKRFDTILQKKIPVDYNGKILFNPQYPNRGVVLNEKMQHNIIDILGGKLGIISLSTSFILLLIFIISTPYVFHHSSYKKN